MAYSLEQSQETVDTQLINIFQNEWAGQKFTASGSYDATKVEIYGAVETWTGSGTYWTTNPEIHIYSESGGDPDSSLGSGTLIFNSGSETTPAWCEAVFDSAISLSNGTTYFIIIDPVTGNAADELEVWGAFPGSGGGFTKSTDDGSSWSGDARFDVGYKLYSGTETAYKELATSDSISFTPTGILNAIIQISATDSFSFTPVGDLDGTLSLTASDSFVFSTSGIITFGPLSSAKISRGHRYIVLFNNDSASYESS